MKIDWELIGIIFMLLIAIIGIGAMGGFCITIVLIAYAIHELLGWLTFYFMVALWAGGVLKVVIDE